MLARISMFVLLVVAFATAAVAATGAEAAPPTSSRLDLELEIYDLHVSSACGADVFANVSGTFDRVVHRDRTGAVDRVTESFHGRITWFIRDSGKSYSSVLASTTRSEFPEGIDFFKPARITVTGLNGGTFPTGGGPPGSGVLTYDGFIYSLGNDDTPYTAVEGDPISQHGDFTTTTTRICAALT